MLNEVITNGRLVDEVKTSLSKNNVAYTRFCLAVRRPGSKEIDENGEVIREPETDFIDCVAFGNQATYLNKFFRKGDGVIVRGSLQTEVYGEEGKKQKRYTVKVDELYCAVAMLDRETEKVEQPKKKGSKK